jgi:archaellum component FlaC
MNQLKLRVHKKIVDRQLDNITAYIAESIDNDWETLSIKDDAEYVIERKNIQLSTIRGRLETLRDQLDTLTGFMERVI